MRHTVRIAVHLALSIAGTALCAHQAAAQDSSAATKPPASESEVSALQEIVVTAERREEKLSDVPISVSAYSQEQMDAQGVRSIDDIARLTPGITFTRTDARNGQASTIDIRGISSTSGSATTGVYIDDTPIQSRSFGYSSYNTFPAVFDLDRVEVLRGPQGTLFGAGSEGGTVRFITPQPSLTTDSGYVRTELGYTEGGSPSYEGGGAFGGPIIDNTLGFRVSAWYRQDGGWVDRVNWDRPDPNPPTAGTRISTLTTQDVIDQNANWTDTSVVTAALTYAPTEDLKITPSVYYQRVYSNDAPFFWEALSSPGNTQYASGNGLSQTSSDRFYLPALKVDWALGPVRLVSNTSYFNRSQAAVNDYGEFEGAIWAGDPYVPTGYYAPAFQTNSQSNLMEELRLSSNDPEARLNWVVGAFFSNSHQGDTELVQDEGLPALFEAVHGIPITVLFPGGLLDGKYTDQNAPLTIRDVQKALYGQADWKVTEKLTLTGGVRVARDTVDASGTFAGPVVGPTFTSSGSEKETPVTPKGGISYKIDGSDMVYATAAKGFRPGGYNPAVGTPCDAQLSALGYDGKTPPLYAPDTVWSYEVGSKNAFLDGRVRLSASAYYIDWKNIQQTVGLSSCGFQFVANLGSASSRGLDFQSDVALTRDLILSVALGYDDAKFDQTVKGGVNATSNLVTDGDHIVGSPFTAAVSGAYNFTFRGRDSYARLDWQFQARQNSLVSANDPLNGSYTPSNLFVQPRASVLSGRVGSRWNGFDVSLFANNLLNSHTILSRSGTPQPPPYTEDVIYSDSTYRPRTYGITAIYRY